MSILKKPISGLKKLLFPKSQKLKGRGQPCKRGETAQKTGCIPNPRKKKGKPKEEKAQDVQAVHGLLGKAANGERLSPEEFAQVSQSLQSLTTLQLRQVLKGLGEKQAAKSKSILQSRALNAFKKTVQEEWNSDASPEEMAAGGVPEVQGQPAEQTAQAAPPDMSSGGSGVDLEDTGGVYDFTEEVTGTPAEEEGGEQAASAAPEQASPESVEETPVEPVPAEEPVQAETAEPQQEEEQTPPVQEQQAPPPSNVREALGQRPMTLAELATSGMNSNAILRELMDGINSGTISDDMVNANGDVLYGLKRQRTEAQQTASPQAPEQTGAVAEETPPVAEAAPQEEPTEEARTESPTEETTIGPEPTESGGPEAGAAAVEDEQVPEQEQPVQDGVEEEPIAEETPVEETPEPEQEVQEDTETTPIETALDDYKTMDQLIQETGMPQEEIESFLQEGIQAGTIDDEDVDEDGNVLYTNIMPRGESQEQQREDTRQEEQTVAPKQNVSKLDQDNMQYAAAKMAQELRNEKYNFGEGYVPIHDLRNKLKETYGEMSDSQFNETMRQLERDGILTLYPISDESIATSEQLQNSIPGIDETLFYVDMNKQGRTPNRPEGFREYTPERANPKEIQPEVENGIRDLMGEGPYVEIHQLRDQIREQFGDSAARHDVFNDILRQMESDGKIRLVPISDLSESSEEQLQSSIPGIDETLYYIEPTDKFEASTPEQQQEPTAEQKPQEETPVEEPEQEPSTEQQTEQDAPEPDEEVEVVDDVPEEEPVAEETPSEEEPVAEEPKEQATQESVAETIQDKTSIADLENRFGDSARDILRDMIDRGYLKTGEPSLQKPDEPYIKLGNVYFTDVSPGERSLEGKRSPKQDQGSSKRVMDDMTEMQNTLTDLQEESGGGKYLSISDVRDMMDDMDQDSISNMLQEMHDLGLIRLVTQDESGLRSYGSDAITMDGQDMVGIEMLSGSDELTPKQREDAAFDRSFELEDMSAEEFESIKDNLAEEGFVQDPDNENRWYYEDNPDVYFERGQEQVDERNYAYEAAQMAEEALREAGIAIDDEDAEVEEDTPEEEVSEEEEPVAEEEPEQEVSEDVLGVVSRAFAAMDEEDRSDHELMKNLAERFLGREMSKEEYFAAVNQYLSGEEPSTEETPEQMEYSSSDMLEDDDAPPEEDEDVEVEDEAEPEQEVEEQAAEEAPDEEVLNILVRAFNDAGGKTEDGSRWGQQTVERMMDAVETFTGKKLTPEEYRAAVEQLRSEGYNLPLPEDEEQSDEDVEIDESTPEQYTGQPITSTEEAMEWIRNAEERIPSLDIEFTELDQMLSAMSKLSKDQLAEVAAELGIPGKHGKGALVDKISHRLRERLSRNLRSRDIAEAAQRGREAEQEVEQDTSEVEDVEEVETVEETPAEQGEWENINVGDKVGEWTVEEVIPPMGAYTNVDVSTGEETEQQPRPATIVATGSEADAFFTLDEWNALAQEETPQQEDDYINVEDDAPAESTEPPKQSFPEQLEDMKKKIRSGDFDVPMEHLESMFSTMSKIDALAMVKDVNEALLRQGKDPLVPGGLSKLSKAKLIDALRNGLEQSTNKPAEEQQTEEPKERGYFDSIPEKLQKHVGKHDDPEIGEGAYPSTLTREEAEALETYTSKHYSLLNRNLRAGTLDQDTTDPQEEDIERRTSGLSKEQRRQLHGQLQQAFEKTKPLENPITVHRGLHLEPEQLESFLQKVNKAKEQGKTIAHDGYISTSRKERKAKDFAYHVGTGDPVILEIEASQGIYVPSVLNRSKLASEGKMLAKDNTEHEFLMNHGSEFEVLGVEKKKRKGKSDVYTVKLKQKVQNEETKEQPAQEETSGAETTGQETGQVRGDGGPVQDSGKTQELNKESMQNLIQDMRSKYTESGAGGRFPIHELRDRIKEEYGPEAASPEVFDKLLKEMRKNGDIRFVAIGDRSRATGEQLANSIQGENETYYLIDVPVQGNKQKPVQDSGTKKVAESISQIDPKTIPDKYFPFSSKEKVTISGMYNHLKDTGQLDMSLEQFKNELVEAYKNREVDMTRADLIQELNDDMKQQVQQSSIKTPTGEFHYIRLGNQ